MASRSIPSTMLEAHISAETTVTLHEVPVPELTHPNQILIAVQAAACNPKDWKLPAGILRTITPIPNSGDDIAGIIVKAGSGVNAFRVGDRVAALHQLGASGGSYAEYAVAWDHLCWHVPKHMSFEAASCTPMGCVMAGLGVFGMLNIGFDGLWSGQAAAPAASKAERTAMIIYGAASNTGAYAVKMAKIVGKGPLICVAGNGVELVESLIDPAAGDKIVNYRGKSGPEMVQALRDAAEGLKIDLAFDAVTEHGSFDNIIQVLDKHGKISLVLPQKIDGIADTIEQSTTMAGSLWPQGMARHDQLGRLGLERGGKEFGLVLSALVGEWLSQGRLEPHPFEVVDGGLNGLEKALQALRQGKVSGKKLVINIRETAELKGES